MPRVRECGSASDGAECETPGEECKTEGAECRTLRRGVRNSDRWVQKLTLRVGKVTFGLDRVTSETANLAITLRDGGQHIGLKISRGNADGEIDAQRNVLRRPDVQIVTGLAVFVELLANGSEQARRRPHVLSHPRSHRR